MNLYKKIKTKSYQVIRYVVEKVCRILSRLGVLSPKVVIRMDGGICSQMNQYLIGIVYKLKGYNVCYDLSWFDEVGVDIIGKYKRYYELEEAFPKLQVDKIQGFERWFYSKFMKHSSQTMELPLVHKYQPIYLGGYYNIPSSDFVDNFKKTFQISQKYSFKKDDFVSCAIHVRRGDLAKGDIPFYGGCSDTYFLNAINYIRGNYSNVKYFFFSDEMDYVEKNIIPKLDSIDYELVKSDKAYKDLLKIASNDIIIASQGSFGKFAAIFNDDSLLIVKDDSHELNRGNRLDWSMRKKKTVCIKE